jgi:hypothetical protein
MNMLAHAPSAMEAMTGFWFGLMVRGHIFIVAFATVKAHPRNS